MNEQQKTIFLAVIAYGIVFVATLLVAGVALGKPSVIGIAVLVAGGSYLTQAISGLSGELSGMDGYGRTALVLWCAALALWVATLALGLTGAIMVVL